MNRSPEQPGASALEYLRQIREARSDKQGIALSTTDPSRVQQPYNQPFPGQTSLQAKYNLAQGQAWSRYPIADGVELSAREPLTSESANRVQQIVAYARRLFQTK